MEITPYLPPNTPVNSPRLVHASHKSEGILQLLIIKLHLTNTPRIGKRLDLKVV